MSSLSPASARRVSSLSARPKMDRRGSLFGSLAPLTEASAVSDLDLRIDELRQALNDPSHHQSAVRNNLANALVQKGDLAEAVEQYKAAIELDSSDAAAIMNLGVAYKFMYRLEDAVSCFRRSLALRPDSDSEHYNLANTLMKLWDLATAKASLTPAEDEARYKLIDEAINHYKECIRLTPEHSNAHMNLGTAYKALGQLSLAMRHMEESIGHAEGESSFNAHYNLANTVASRCASDVASPAGGGAPNSSSSSAAGKRPQPESLIPQGDPSWRTMLLLAAKHYKEALEIDSESVDALMNYGVVLSRLEMHQESVEIYEDLLELASEDYSVHFNCGNSKAGMGDFEGAIVQYKNAIELHGGMHLPSMYNMGMALMELERFEEAIPVFLDVLEEDEEEDPIIYYNLGIMYHRVKDNEAAVEALEACVALDPSNVPAHISLGNLLDERGERSGAAEHYRAAVGLEPDNFDAKRYLAYTLAELEGVDEACELLERCLLQQPDSEEVKAFLAQCREKLNSDEDLAQQIREATEAVAKAGTVANRANLAVIQRTAQHFDEAIEQLEECLRLQPGHPQIARLIEEVKAEKEAAEGEKEIGEQEVVESTGRFGMFAGKKKGRGLSSTSPGKKVSPPTLEGTAEGAQGAKGATSSPAVAKSPNRIAKNKVAVSG